MKIEEITEYTERGSQGERERDVFIFSLFRFIGFWHAISQLDFSIYKQTI